MKSILDPSFRYTPSTQTDIRKTFARVRREQRLAAQAPPSGPQLPSRVLPISFSKQRASR